MYLCKGYTTEGEPIDPVLNKKIPPKQTVCILFTYKDNQHDDKIIFLYIDKVNSNIQENYFSKLIRVDRDKKWLAINYKFEDESMYEIYFTNFNRRKISSASLNVSYPLPKNVPKKLESDAYPDIRVFFCHNSSRSWLIRFAT